MNGLRGGSGDAAGWFPNVNGRYTFPGRSEAGSGHGSAMN